MTPPKFAEQNPRNGLGEDPNLRLGRYVELCRKVGREPKRRWWITLPAGTPSRPGEDASALDDRRLSPEGRGPRRFGGADAAGD